MEFKKGDTVIIEESEHLVNEVYGNPEDAPGMGWLQGVMSDFDVYFDRKIKQRGFAGRLFSGPGRAELGVLFESGQKRNRRRQLVQKERERIARRLNCDTDELGLRDACDAEAIAEFQLASELVPRYGKGVSPRYGYIIYDILPETFQYRKRRPE